MKYLLFVIAFVVGIQVASAQDTALRIKHYNISNGLALSGYDPVAYFTQHAAQKGSTQFTYTYQGITYHFSSAQNLAAFKANPTAYEPQYGGWCAYAMGATAEKVSIDPGTFKIIDGKLYLYYNKWLTNTLTSWNKDENHLKTQADANWKKIYH